MTTRRKRKLLEGVPPVCAYCGITEKECNDYFGKNPKFTRGGHRGKRLEVDRIDSSLDYMAGNVCWACYVCNNSKSNYCNSAKDFEPIANGIRQFWRNLGYHPKP